MKVLFEKVHNLYKKSNKTKKVLPGDVIAVTRKVPY